MIAYLGLLLIAGVPANEAQPRTVVVQSGPLDIPDEIAPAVLPYTACLTAAKG